MSRIPLTMEGAERLRKELNHLKKNVRPQIIHAIAEARAHGDLRENAEYHAAREQQGFTEGRIQELEASLSQAQVIDLSKLNPGGKVVFGARVTLKAKKTDEKSHYQIVGDLEADIQKGRVSISSPIARAMIGKEKGDSVKFKAPGGVQKFKIVAVSYGG